MGENTCLDTSHYSNSNNLQLGIRLKERKDAQMVTFFFFSTNLF